MTLDGLSEDFRDLLADLSEAGADFLIVGAYALAFHGARLKPQREPRLP